MFIRIKKIKNNNYAYLVENTWKKRKQSSRQIVKKYLGKIIEIKKKKDEPYPTLENKNFQESVLILLTWQLKQCGFSESNGKLALQEIIIDLEHKNIEREKKEIVLKLNEGYLSNYSLQKILTFKGKGYEEEVGLQLAEHIVNVGLDIPKELFVQLFEKIYQAPEE